MWARMSKRGILHLHLHLIFFVVVYLNINFRLNGGGESSTRGLKNFSSFFLNELKEQGHCDRGDEYHR